METLSHAWQSLLGAMGTTHPALLMLALALLPLVGVPASPLIIAAGARMGTAVGFVAVMVSLTVNFTVGYWLARRWLRSWLTVWLARRGYAIPQLAPGDESQFILLFRITPGMPLTVQNYVLGLAGVGFARYMLISLPVQAVYALAFVWFGQSLTGKATWKLALGVALLVAVGLVVSLLRRYLSRRRAGGANSIAP